MSQMPAAEPQKLNVLLVGSGGREHAIAWKLAQSPRLGRLWCAPGNPGTAQFGENLPIRVEDMPGLVAAALAHHVDLVVIGPEIPLALGLADALREASLPVFGPGLAAAQIESSKVFSKAFMARHSIPSAQYAAFTSFDLACQYLETIEAPVVIKASGLAAGKGVFLPESRQEAVAVLSDLLLTGSLGEAGRSIVIEERLVGEEVSLLAFTDGSTVCAMPPAQDHKRLLEGDAGPNTGGMGAIAPTPAITQAQVEQAVREILQPAVAGLRAEGAPFVGVLYAGLMLTPSGPKVLEFNCRFGDPETQAILPLLDSDLLVILQACAAGRLSPDLVSWKNCSCASVVLAAGGYPQGSAAGLPISGLETARFNCVVFHAGTRLLSGQVVASGGRVLAVTAWAADLQHALDEAYAGVCQVHFLGMQYRRDIGARALARLADQQLAAIHSSYAKSGVSIDAGNRAVQLMGAAVRSTYTPAVLAGIGAFGGLFSADSLTAMRRPVLVASTDGVGTKVKLAAALGRYQSIGQDIVNHCINDILVQGARPLFFLDYFATSRLTPEITAEIVSGIAEACRAAGCVLLGGETAEMPGVYAPGEFDVAGTIVGAVEYDRILPSAQLQAGDLLVGLASSGPHTNGYSLIRQVFADVPMERVFPELGRPLGAALLEPHRSYLPLLAPLLDRPDCPIKGLAHLTGGGFIENIPRILPAGLGAVIRRGSWPIPPLFRLIQSHGKISHAEMARVFNLGIGMLAVVSPQDCDGFLASLPEPAWVVGELVPGEHKVSLL